jgi:hypothetical protein
MTYGWSSRLRLELGHPEFSLEKLRINVHFAGCPWCGYDGVCQGRNPVVGEFLRLR